VHVAGAVDPLHDIGVINTELVLADIETVDRALQRAEKQAKTARKEDVAYRDLLVRMSAHLNSEQPARAFPYQDTERDALKDLCLLTDKPVMYVANVDEAGLLDESEYVTQVKSLADAEQSVVVVICAAVEAEIAVLDEQDKQEFVKELGLDEPGLNRVIRAAYNLLGLQTFFTAGEKEVRAWTVKIGATAPEAAGEIHTDFQKGFIRAETIAYDDYIKGNGEQGAREAGRLRAEGKNYVLHEGDVVHFLFNV
jgi:GTP-binding protein YchF